MTYGPAALIYGPPKFDEKDRGILHERRGLYLDRQGPVVGHWVEFADGVVRRISHVWDWGMDWEGPGVQTSDGGSFYLGRGYMSFSGSLYPSIPVSALKDTGFTRDAPAWFFHHDWHEAFNGVEVMMPCKVWSCSLPANR